MRIGRGIEVSAENLPWCHIFQNKSHMSWPGIETRPPQWEAGKSSTVRHLCMSFHRTVIYIIQLRSWCEPG
jgi:hypothetical protein